MAPEEKKKQRKSGKRKPGAPRDRTQEKHLARMHRKAQKERLQAAEADSAMVQPLIAECVALKLEVQTLRRRIDELEYEVEDERRLRHLAEAARDRNRLRRLFG